MLIDKILIMEENKRKSRSLISINIKNLKGLKDVEITFKQNGLTAIMGPNGSGKSTILYALACTHNGKGSHRFCEYFLPTTNNTWIGSEFSIKYRYLHGQGENEETKKFSKIQGRWNPKYATRYNRQTLFIGLSTAHPIIEAETRRSRLRFTKSLAQDPKSNLILQTVGRIMNRNYEELHDLRAGKKHYAGVKLDQLSYSSLSMGAGEQRLFKIISEIINCDDYSLVLIDEIDVLMHQEALIRLLHEIDIIARQKHLQIIFTSHNQSITKCSFIDFRHIFQTPHKTVCINDTTPNALKRLTGKIEKPISIYVEDEMAQSIVSELAQSLNIFPFINIERCGTAANVIAFASSATLIIKQDIDNNNVLFVLDGDVITTPDKKKNEIKRHINGNDPMMEQLRNKALSVISQFNLPEGKSPEEFINGMIRNYRGQTTPDEQQLIDAAQSINNPADKHQYLDDIIIDLQNPPDIAYYRIMRLAKKCTDWDAFVEPIKIWLESKVGKLINP